MGYFDVSYYLTNDDGSVVSKNLATTNDDDCVFCCGTLKENDEVAVYDGCDRPHCLHVKCFYEYISDKVGQPHEDDDDVNKLVKMKNCSICRESRVGTWREWKYSKIVTLKWKKGKELPDDKIKVLGIHQYKNKNVRFANFITCKILLFAMKKNINNETDVKAYRPRHMDNGPITIRYTKYVRATTMPFTCHFCKLRFMKWKECRLRGCNNRCTHRFCRDCFITHITSEFHTNVDQHIDGYMTCPLCKKYSRAVFTQTDTYCSSGTKK